MRASIIELRNSGSAMRRLLPEYISSIKGEEMNDAGIGEISTIVRALRSSLDKAANKIYLLQFGVSSKRTYFPLTSDPDVFDKLLQHNLKDLSIVNARISEVIRQCQPFMPGFASLAQLSGLYRTNMHHSFELHEIRPTWHFTEGEVEEWGKSWAPGVDTWMGIDLNRRTYTDVSGQEIFQAALTQDWYFSGTSNSVMGSLLSIHNATVQAIQLLADACGKPMSVGEVASVQLRARRL